MSLNRERLHHKTQGSLWGVFIGDSFALPVECKSPREIQHLYGYLDDFVDNKHHGYKAVARRSAGTISDDSQLTLAMMDSLCRRRGYDLQDIKRAHVEALKGKWGTPVGWGGSTRTACDNIVNKKNPTYAPLGAGNGPVIKIAPLAIYCVYKTMGSYQDKFTNSFNHALLKKCREISMISHGDPACVVATYCHARMLIRAMQDELPKGTLRLAELFLQDAWYAEKMLESMYEAKWTDGLLSARMREFLVKDMFDRTTASVSVAICTDRSSYIYNSYPLVAYCVCKYLPFRNFRYACTETANAGADADSNASMVLSIVGAHLGVSDIPVWMVKSVKKWNDLMGHVRTFEQSL